ncbi:MAG TPA: hypothetical protein VGM84_09950 [Steroidobacteraceae bacterium]|jgi:multisubunit Na+/H+ antiporter MnhG subunit
MRTLLTFIVQWLWPARPAAPRGGPSADRYLKVLIVLLIALACGPDLYVAMEFTTLLEVLGATLFLLSFAVGFQVLGLAAWDCLRRLLLPVEHVALVQIRGKPLARMHGASLICRNGLYLYCLGFLAYVWVRELVGLLT